MNWIWTLFIFLFGCGGKIKELYEKERKAVFAQTMEVPANWEPDARLRISYKIIDTLAKENLQQTLGKGKFTFKALGIPVTINSSNQIKELAVSDHISDDAFQFSTKIKGKASWDSAILKGSLPYTAQVKGKAKIIFEDQKFYAKISTIDKLVITNQGTGKLDLSKPLKKWLKGQIKKSKKIQLGRINLKKFQMRASRVRSHKHSADLELLSNTTNPQAIPLSKEAPKGDWELELSNAVITSWIRRAAFTKGIVSHGVAIDPQSFQLQDKNFQIDLRLWKIKGWGKWWRDYKVEGNIKVNQKKLKLKGESVTEGAKSPGAGFADPLALLAEGLILESIEKNIRFGIPAQHSAKINKERIVAQTADVSGNEQRLVVWGQLEQK